MVELLGGKSIQDGKNERGGFSSSCLCNANYVMASNHLGNNLGLNGRWLFIAKARNGAQQRFGKAEFSK